MAASSCSDLELFSHSSASPLALYTPLCSPGHEHPFSIAVSSLRDSADQQQGTNDNTLPADGTETSFLDQLPKEKQCQFVLKPRLQAPVQLRRGRGCECVLTRQRLCCFPWQCQALPSISRIPGPRSHLSVCREEGVIQGLNLSVQIFRISFWSLISFQLQAGLTLRRQQGH